MTTVDAQIVSPPVALFSARKPGSNALSDRGRWNYVIESKLADWDKHPEKYEDDGFVPATRKIINRASELAAKLRDSGAPAPTQVAMTGEGGIVFENREGTHCFLI